MPIVGTGRVSMSEIRGEFGGAEPDALSEYYKGGVNVPELSEGDIPESGPISFSDFRNTANVIPPPVEIGENILEYSIAVSNPNYKSGGYLVANGYQMSPGYGVESAPDFACPYPAIFETGDINDQTYQFDNLNEDADYKLTWNAGVGPTSGIYSYGYISVVIFKNGELLESIYTPDNSEGGAYSYWRVTGADVTRESSTHTFGYGDEIRVLCTAYRRASYVPFLTFEFFNYELERVA